MPLHTGSSMNSSSFAKYLLKSSAPPSPLKSLASEYPSPRCVASTSISSRVRPMSQRPGSLMNPSTSSPHAPDGLRAHRCAGVLNGSATERPNVHHPKTARECQWRCHARASMSTLCKSVNVDAAQARQYRCRMCIDRNLRDKDINAPRELAQFREDRIAVCFPSRRFISNNLACPEWLVASR
ncbi:hypothetical protein K523DRAFT_141568 [Schizophyllum commune Tattone D]|nr:hypothetical protein K523DRAFT_141568 [Schizophyllum commune Tattone D]